MGPKGRHVGDSSQQGAHLSLGMESEPPHGPDPKAQPGPALGKMSPGWGPEGRGCRRSRAPAEGLGRADKSQILELVGFRDIHRPSAHLQALPSVEQLRLLHPWGVEDRRAQIRARLDRVSASPSLPSCSPGAKSWCGPLLELCFLIWGMLDALASGVLLIPRQSQLLSRKPACHLQTSKRRAGSLNTNFVHRATNLREIQ